METGCKRQETRQLYVQISDFVFLFFNSSFCLLTSYFKILDFVFLLFSFCKIHITVSHLTSKIYYLACVRDCSGNPAVATVGGARNCSGKPDPPEWRATERRRGTPKHFKNYTYYSYLLLILHKTF